jgi:hypothetical protein
MRPNTGKYPLRITHDAFPYHRRMHGSGETPSADMVLQAIEFMQKKLPSGCTFPLIPELALGLIPDPSRRARTQVARAGRELWITDMWMSVIDFYVDI